MGQGSVSMHDRFLISQHSDPRNECSEWSLWSVRRCFAPELHALGYWLVIQWHVQMPSTLIVGCCPLMRVCLPCTVVCFSAARAVQCLYISNHTVFSNVVATAYISYASPSPKIPTAASGFSAPWQCYECSTLCTLQALSPLLSKFRPPNDTYQISAGNTETSALETSWFPHPL